MDQYSLFILLSPFASAMMIATSVYCFRHQNLPTAKPLGLTTLFEAVYIISNALELASPTESGTLFFAKLCYVCISMITIYWLAFALAFSRQDGKWRSKYFYALWLIPFCAVVLVFTNSYHHLIWNSYEFFRVSHGFLYMKVTSYGSFFWVFWIQAYLLILITALLAVWTSFVQRNRYRIQAILIFIASLFPLSINMIYVFHLIPGLQKDFSPLAYALSGGLMVFSIFRFQLLDLLPFARSVVIDEMADVMLTLNKERKIVDYNRAAITVLHLDQFSHRINQTISGLIFPYLDRLEKEPVQDLLKTEVRIDLNDKLAYFDLQIRRLRNQFDAEVVGYLILLHSITEHKNLLQEIRVLAEHDMLTGLFNRSYFEEVANQMIRTGNNVFSILMIDIDCFKNINDSIGHRGGDQILQAIARRMQKSLRSNDIIGRFGGDEFVVLLPRTESNMAKILADRLCSLISASPFQTDEKAVFSLSISVGISEYSEEYGGSLEQILVQADQALYQAKTQGRNRSHIYIHEEQAE